MKANNVRHHLIQVKGGLYLAAEEIKETSGKDWPEMKLVHDSIMNIYAEVDRLLVNIKAKL